MALETKYEHLYRERGDVCGDPFPEFVDFAESYSDRAARVLDLGCGQGRDSFVFARRGMAVMGVDISPTGIEQMMAAADANGLPITGVVADIRNYSTNKHFDIIILDRTLHMLSKPDARIEIISRCADWLSDGGHILIADEPSNIRAFVAWFQSDFRNWNMKPKMKPGFCFVQLKTAKQPIGG